MTASSALANDSMVMSRFSVACATTRHQCATRSRTCQYPVGPEASFNQASVTDTKGLRLDPTWQAAGKKRMGRENEAKQNTLERV